MRHRAIPANAIVVIFVAALIAGANGCQHSSTQPRRPRPTVSIRNGGTSTGNDAATIGIPVGGTDACAANLHDLAGSFLLYYAMRHELPPTLDALSQVDAVNAAEFSCPISHRRYIYNPTGVLAPGNNGRAVLCDSAPSHNGMRYALAITEPQGNAALIAKVIAIPEATFVAAAAAAEAPQQQQPSPEPARPPQRTAEER
jgi:hypothetical protein